MLLKSLYALVVPAVLAFDVNLVWDVPDNALDLTQASAHVALNSSSSPIGTEWIGVGWDSGAISLQKLRDNSLAVILQVRTPTNESTVRAGRVTEYATAHYIDKEDKQARQGMYLMSKVDHDDSMQAGYSLKVVAHYNMVSNNTIYQGLWSDGDIWTYMGSIILQHPSKGSIKDEVSKALEEAAKPDSRAMVGGDDRTRVSAEGSGSSPQSTDAPKDPLGGAKPPETLATCEINREASGRIRPVCRFIRQLPMVPSFSKPFSGVRRTAGGDPKSERAGVFKDLVLKSRLADVYDISGAKCVSHNRGKDDIASCQRDPNSPEFYIAIDGGADGVRGEQSERSVIVEGEDPDKEFEEERSLMHHDTASKLPEVNII
ncbi:hypothetical protein EC988_001207 [Linderina pennispora]|nr:hypothetical protein EC988_001207 [Linderina pennispora]